MKSQRSLDLDSEGIVQKISAVFYTRIDSLENSVERMISNNTLKIEVLKKTVDFACAEIREVKELICQTILPEHKAKLPDVIDSVHRLGQPKKDATKTRGIILQFGARIYREAVWEAAEKSSFLQNNKPRFAEDLSPAVRERRMQLCPLVAKAREQGNAAYFLGGRAFANGAELFPVT
ncbi:hypothetical protein DPEC_G00167750 [Dallia pectoralis]|uniref:Uncharacterized protein n=1 Tax=Dallia pectoralis TaxID=75939 RepID=A0ACC2GI83_DALPE|nr:hypothetical protein DPEC_G00167750 [Dallia pectoralis]